MPKTKVEVYDKDQLIYPYIESDHVTFSNGMKVGEMLDQSISMPTVTHEDLSFKVGVGDQDVSSAIVDSSVSEMTIKGKTYQNILPEPSTHVLTNNKEMFKVNGGLDSNVEIVDGVSKSAILSGNTLVNLFPIDEVRKALPADWKESSKGVFEYTSSSTPRDSVTRDITLTQPLIAGKTYILKHDSDNTTDCASIGFVFPNETTGSWFQGVAVNSGKLGTTPKIITYTPKVDIKTVRMGRWNNDYVQNTTVNIKYPMILEYQQGMENWNIPYFEGMSSVKMPVLTTIGKNLFDGILEDGMIDANGILGSGGIAKRSVNYIKVKPKTTYTLSCSNGYTHLYIHEYDSNYNSIVEKSSNTFTTESSTMYIKFNSHATLDLGNPKIQLEEYSQATPYEPHKTNILHTPEEVVLRSVENAQDTINLNTGEYVQRIGEVILNGSESWHVLDNNTENTIGFTLRNVLPLKKTGDKYVKVNCDKLPSYKENLWNNDKIGCVAENNINQDLNDTQLQVRVLKSTLSTQDTNGFKSWLQTNPLKIQYILETPIVKTVNLSSSGNWEKVVLDGSETGWSNSYSEWANKVFCLNNSYLPNVIKPTSTHDTYVMCDKLRGCAIQWLCAELGRTGVALHSWGSGYLQIAINGVNTVDELKQYLSQNPITVWYQTTNHKDSTQVKQPIFFKDGHIQLSSRADNSLIPTLDYQAKTSNSYVMDLMKTNTKYTMKAKTASGTFTIDGTSYGAGTNGTFTTPTSMANKFLVMSNKTNEEVMILEGDVTSKIIPYFKGIKSAFEDESKIEVLSTGKNLFDMNRRYDKITNAQATVVQNVDEITISSVESGTYVNVNFVLDKNFFKGKTVTGSCLYESDEKGIGTVQINYQDTTGKKYYQSIKTSRTFTFPDEFVGEVLLCVYANNTNTPQSNTVTVKNIQLELGTMSTTYDSHKSNVSKIPLLSPLRSLPNGVCDELIVDRMKNKATLIQRVGHVVFTSNLGYNAEQDSLKTSLFTSPAIYPQASGVRMCNRFLNDEKSNLMLDSMQAKTESEGLGSWSSKENFNIRILASRLGGIPSTSAMTNWLKENPVTILYHLKTPIVTEIDLEGFPYIYKEGHIFLNSEIAPTTEITYSINQCQQISASNEDIIRHEKELTYLQKLIAQYVQVDYESALLSLKV